jgi:hypothetical protein
MKDLISFSLSLAQGNLILEALVERPFKEVFETIGHLNQQAAASFPEGSDEDDIGTINVSASQLRLILSVLGNALQACQCPVTQHAPANAGGKGK